MLAAAAAKPHMQMKKETGNALSIVSISIITGRRQHVNISPTPFYSAELSQTAMVTLPVCMVITAAAPTFCLADSLSIFFYFFYLPVSCIIFRW